jgi:diazepam-binding inhibitor (GABA receptor modulator, acyl-CoA-binding protein)
MVGVLLWRREGLPIIAEREPRQPAASPCGRRDPVSDLKKKFDDAAAAVKKLKEDPGNDVKLQLYALYKQGAEGDVAGKRPGFTDMIGRAKFDAWTKVKGLSKDEAMKKYVELVKSVGG